MDFDDDDDIEATGFRVMMVLAIIGLGTLGQLGIAGLLSIVLFAEMLYATVMDRIERNKKNGDKQKAERSLEERGH